MRATMPAHADDCKDEMLPQEAGAGAHCYSMEQPEDSLTLALCITSRNCARHTSHITRQTSHVTRHTSHVTHHSPYISLNLIVALARLGQRIPQHSRAVAVAHLKPQTIKHHPSPITHHPSPITHHPSTITHHPSPINHHPSNIKHQTSPITRHAHTFFWLGS